VASPRPAGKSREQIAAEQVFAYEARLQHRGYRWIAEQLGVSLPTAFRRVTQEMERRVSPLREQVRQMESDRIDEASRIAWEIATNTELDPETRLKAIDRMERLSEQQSKLYGAYEPVRSIVAQVGDDADPEMAALLVQARAEIAAEQRATEGADDGEGA
jgi:DNA-binding Lrp family transcriptional regulator